MYFSSNTFEKDERGDVGGGVDFGQKSSRKVVECSLRLLGSGALIVRAIIVLCGAQKGDACWDFEGVSSEGLPRPLSGTSIKSEGSPLQQFSLAAVCFEDAASLLTRGRLRRFTADCSVLYGNRFNIIAIQFSIISILNVNI